MKKRLLTMVTIIMVMALTTGCGLNKQSTDGSSFRDKLMDAIIGKGDSMSVEEIEGDENGYRPGETEDSINFQTTTDVPKNTVGPLPYDKEVVIQEPLDDDKPFGFYYVLPDEQKGINSYYSVTITKGTTSNGNSRASVDFVDLVTNESKHFLLVDFENNNIYENDGSTTTLLHDINDYWTLRIKGRDYQLQEPNEYTYKYYEIDGDYYRPFLKGVYEYVDDNGNCYGILGISQFYNSNAIVVNCYTEDFELYDTVILDSSAFSYEDTYLYADLYGDSDMYIESTRYQMETVSIYDEEYALRPLSTYDLYDVNSMASLTGDYIVTFEDGTTGKLGVSCIDAEDQDDYYGYYYSIECDYVRAEGVASPQNDTGEVLVSADITIDFANMTISLPGANDGLTTATFVYE